MQIASLVYRPEDSLDRRLGALCVLGLWAVAVAVLLLHHAYWRDEVRALSLALQGDTVLDMLRGVHGDGHPAVWHLLLRGAHAVLPTPAVLPIVAAAIAAAAAALLTLRSPFSVLVIGAVLLGRLGVYEYSVMARNYGISMLLMFAFAALYRTHRERGVVLGLVLALLANTNVHSALLVGAFLLFWLLDLLFEGAANRDTALRNFVINAVVAALGVALCVATIYPPFNDAAVDFVPPGAAWQRLLMAVFVPGAAFGELAGFVLPDVARSVLQWPPSTLFLAQVLLSGLLFASVAGLSRRRAAVVASLVALLGLSIVFNFIYVGHYRHQGLWIVFLVAMYWIAGDGAPSRSASAGTDARRNFGLACFVVLLALQVAIGLVTAVSVTSGKYPESRSRELAQLIQQRPELRNATILADPDYLVESLPYYLPNRTYLPREQRFGNVVHFTRNARLDLYLRDILDEARRLRSTTGEPVVILLVERLDPDAPTRVIHEGYNWRTWHSPEQVREFLSSTRRIARFDYACCNDESYDVYVLD